MSSASGSTHRRPVPKPPPVRRRTVLSAPSRRQSQLPVRDETSAGGIAVDESQHEPRVPIIARRNRGGRLEWCLPKGHLEGTETPAEAAEREIHEETGIKSEVIQPLGTIDYWFSSTTHRIHKVVHHFLLHAIEGELTIENDPDGEAEDVAWIALPDLASALVYPNEKRLARRALELWGDR